MRRLCAGVLSRALGIILSITLGLGPSLGYVRPAFAAEVTTQPAAVSTEPVSAAADTSPTVVRELPERRTENSTSYSLSNGDIRTVVSEGAVRFRDDGGDWSPIDTTLVPGDEVGELVSASTSVTASFKAQAPGESPVTLEGDDFSVGINMLGVTEDAKLAADDTVKYLVDLPSGVTLDYQVLGDGLKETVVLADADAPTSFEFSLALDGLELRRAPGGSHFFFRPGEADPVLELGALSVFDSAGKGDTMANAVCEQATMTVTSVDGDTAKVRYEVSPAWLKDPARVFPVMVDPSIMDPTGDTWVHEGYPTYTKWNETYLCAGRTGGDRLRSFLKFDLSGIPTGAGVTSATMKLYQGVVYGTDRTVGYGYVSSAFNSSTCWNNAPSITSVYTLNSLPSSAGWVELPCTPLVSDWVTGSKTNNGFGVMRDNASGTNYRRFWSKEYSEASLRPKLEVTWQPPTVTGLTYTQTPSSGWFREVDRDNDGVADTVNDKPTQGRGAVNLSWNSAAGADGYRIYALDGKYYRKVGETLGGSATSWSSSGARLFPKDSAYATREDDMWTANPFTGAAPLTTGLRDKTVTLADGGAGVVVSDGSHLYYRAWSTYPGPTKWKRITGMNGELSTPTVDSVGPDFASKPIISAFHLDGVIYNGYATSPTTIEGVPVGASSDATQTRTLTFSQPLLDRTTGSAMSGAGNNIQLAATDERIYSASYTRTSGAYDGFRIREYDRDGTFIADHDIVCPSFYMDGLIADGDNLYFTEWGSANRVAKISTSSWKVTNQFTSGWTGGSNEINGCYDAANDVFWTGALDSGRIYRYPGPGLDLRDSVKPLFEKTPGEAYDTNSYYAFRVAAYTNTGGGEVPVLSCPEVALTLDNRTVRVNDDPRHTTHDLGTLHGHEARIQLDTASLELDVTDLSIASWGPEAMIARHYSSHNTTAVAFARGWTFNFESHLTVGTNTADYYDESGERHRFTKDAATGIWAAPNGDYSAIAYTNGTWSITTKDRSVLTFASTGKIASVTDANGNAVTYNWSLDNTHLKITAANSQSIEATFTAAGRIRTAAYATPEGPRTVEYDYGNGFADNDWDIVRYCTEADELPRIAIYDYTPTTHLRIESISDPRQVGANDWGAYWSFYYDGLDRVDEVRWPGCDDYRPYGDNDRRRRSKVDYGSWRTATVTTAADPLGPSGADVMQVYAWNPTGTEAWHSNRKYASDSGLETWDSIYDSQNELASTTSPRGVTTRTVYDGRGNARYEFDGKGGMTTNVYDALDRCIRTTSPAGRTSYTAYDTSGNVTSEERVLTAAGERARSEYTYDSYGRKTMERQRISQGPDTWAQTDYADFATNGEPQTITQKNVKLSSTGSPVDLVATKSYDSDGKLQWEKNAKGDWVSKNNLYDIFGALISSEDASGVVTHHAYDVFGFETETSRTAGNAWSDWKRMVYIPNGQVYRESWMDMVDGEPTAVRTDVHTVDAVGNETEIETPEGATQLGYDAQGQVISQTVPGVAAAAETVYDDDGNVTTETVPGNADPDVYEYDENDEVIAEDPADAEETSHTFDADGNETATFEPLQGSGVATSTSTYDVGERLTKSTDEKGFTTTFGYDQLDRQLTATSGGVSSTKTYNTLGQVLSETDLDGQVKTYTYDGAGRVVSDTLSGKVTSRTYDGTGRELSRALPDGSTIAFAYDALGRLDTETHSKSGIPVKNWVHSYDALGRDVATTETISGVSTAREWAGDSPSRVTTRYGSLATTATLTAGAETGLSVHSNESTITATRSVGATDTAGRPVGYTLDAGVSRSQTTTYFSTTGKLKAQYGLGLGTGGIAYDYSSETARQNSENIDLAYPATAADRNRAFGYDAAGRLTTATDTAGAVYSFNYLADGKMTGNGGRTFAYDAAGRLATMTVASATTTYTNDSRGRRTGHRSPAEAVVYSYDDADHLSGFTRDVGKNGSVETCASYAYDSTGQRTRSVVTSGSVTTTTTYIYEGLKLLSATSVVGTATTSVAYVNDSAGLPVAAYVSLPDTTTPVFVWIVTNQRGDVLELLDANGDPLAYHAYTPYGEALSTGARAIAGSITATQAAGVRDAIELRFAGYSWDDESGLYYCSQRYYDPVTCQWITKDPARADGEESAYQYCGGDPVESTDPSGLVMQLAGSKLSARDRQNAKKHPIEALWVADAWKQATIWQFIYYPGDFTNGNVYGADSTNGNAFKHAFWNAAMVQRFVTRLLMTPHRAKKRAAKWSTGHELTKKEAKKASKARRRTRRMDLYNNRQGRAIGVGSWWLPDVALAPKVHDAVVAGQMRYLEADGKGHRKLWRKTYE